MKRKTRFNIIRALEFTCGWIGGRYFHDDWRFILVLIPFAIVFAYLLRVPEPLLVERSETDAQTVSD